MKFNKIVGFGDSWVWGDELLDPELKFHPRSHCSLLENRHYREQHCFLGQLGQYYNTPVENFGIPGGSMQSSIWTFLWWLDHEEHPENCLILVGHTDSHRFSHYNPNHKIMPNDYPWNKFIHSSWPENPGWENLIKQQTVLTDCQELQALRYQETVLVFDGVAARQNLNLIQFNLADPLRSISYATTLAWPTWSFSSWFVKEIQPIHGRKYINPNGHPNEIGHELIRDRLISYIDSCTM